MFDPELDHLPPEARWREWMNRVEATIFAASEPVGRETLVRQAGIAEQTYYHWRKAATPVSDSDDLKDLVALEDENKRLKSLLAERLRKENAELKKKLGLAQ
ncbi:transcriptional regulator [Mesorhizobium alhagi CCNWXJ12-2]|uniref:Transcriptional regulator n=1 Tax=Mesorhizobium alhagi CCNWXJ12-2 TaxID=1107882 RepID=H0HQ89_9HYPH|nr:transcriptional regulator [Mesorhizobium alhagi CCNWXJ12-2]